MHTHGTSVHPEADTEGTRRTMDETNDQRQRRLRDESARTLGLCCAEHAYNTADGTHPEWACKCIHCTTTAEVES